MTATMEEKNVTGSQPQHWTAGDLVLAGRCTPQCLLAFNRKCDCPCGGRWHGALTGAEIGGPRTPWHERHCGYSQLVLDQMCPAIRAGIPLFNHHYREAQRGHRVFAVAQRRGRTWETHVDVCTQWGRHNGHEWLSEESVELWEQIVVALMRGHRVRSGSAGREMLTAYGVKTQAEAQILGALGVELHAGNTDGAQSCRLPR